MWDVNYDWVLLSTSYTYQILFIHIKLRCLPYFICSGQAYACVLTPLVPYLSDWWAWWYGRTGCWFLAQVVLLCCDWGLPSTSYTYQTHFIHILNKMFGHTLYAVGSHMSVSLLRIWFGSGRRYNRKVYCWWYAVNLVFNPLYTLIKSIIHIHKLFELL